MRSLAPLFVLLLVFATSPVRGQGMEHQLPDPVSTLRLHLMLDRLIEPHDPRWAAIEAEHDRYLAAYRALAAERVPRVLAGLRDMVVVDQRTLREARDFSNLLRAEEERLLTAVGEILGESSLAPLAQVRVRREVERIGSTLAASVGMPSQWSLLSEAVRAAVTDRATIAEIEPLLETYEARAVALVRKAADRGFAALEEGIRAVREAQPPIDIDAPEGLQRWYDLLFAGGVAQRAERDAALMELRRLDHATLRSLRPHLGLLGERRVRWSLERADPLLVSQGQGWIEVLFRLALASDQLDAAQKEAALERYALWAAEDAANADAIIDILGEGPDLQAAWHAAMQRRRDANSVWTNRLLQEKAPWIEPIRERWMTLVNGRSDDEFAPFDSGFLIDSPLPRPYDHDARWRPRPISGDRVESLADRLRLDDGNRAIVRSMLADARLRWERELAPLAAEVHRAERTARRIEGERVVLEPDAVGAIGRARLAVLEGAARVDEAFYDDLHALLARQDEAASSEIALSRCSRALERLGVGDWAIATLPEMIVRPVDPVAVLDALPLDEAARAEARSALLARRDEILAAARSRAISHAAAESEIAAAMQRGFRLQMLAGDPDASEEERVAAQAEMAEAWEDEERIRARAIAIRLAADRTVRECFDDAIGHLDERSRLDAIEGYERRAVPEFFHDDRSARPYLDRASALAGLPEHGRAAIAALDAAYRADMAALARRFGDHRRLAPPEATGTAWRRHEAERRRTEAAIRFERDERSARVVSALRRLLGPEASAQVRGLDDYERRTEVARTTFIRVAE